MPCLKLKRPFGLFGASQKASDGWRHMVSWDKRSFWKIWHFLDISYVTSFLKSCPYQFGIRYSITPGRLSRRSMIPWGDSKIILTHWAVAQVGSNYEKILDVENLAGMYLWGILASGNLLKPFQKAASWWYPFRPPETRRERGSQNIMDKMLLLSSIFREIKYFCSYCS